jgi:tetrapyrrole methylase family protein/MazG family protein
MLSNLVAQLTAQKALDKLDEETAELRQAVEAGQPVDSPHGIREELGDALFILCKIAQMSGVDPEDALHRACDKYQGRFRRVADAADRPLNAYTEAEKIALWEQAKEN